MPDISNTQIGAPRADHCAIAERIKPSARILDIGCGHGELLALLRDAKNVDARGLELTQAGVESCLSRGLSVVQGDAEQDLTLFPDNSFDVAILSQTLQVLRHPKQVLEELKRISPEIILSFRNFGHWRTRVALGFTGRMPARTGLAWHDALSLHPATLTDVLDLAQNIDLRVMGISAIHAGKPRPFTTQNFGQINLFAEDVILHLARN